MDPLSPIVVMAPTRRFPVSIADERICRRVGFKCSNLPRVTEGSSTPRRRLHEQAEAA